MPRKVDSKIIFSASEVGEFVLCPESWRLKYLDKKSHVVPESHVISDESKVQGQVVHEDWGKSIDLKLELKSAFRLAFTIFMSALVLLLFTRILRSPETKKFLERKERSFRHQEDR